MMLEQEAEEETVPSFFGQLHFFLVSINSLSVSLYLTTYAFAKEELETMPGAPKYGWISYAGDKRPLFQLRGPMWLLLSSTGTDEHSIKAKIYGPLHTHTRYPLQKDTPVVCLACKMCSGLMAWLGGRGKKHRFYVSHARMQMVF